MRQTGNERCIVIPRCSSENRDYLPVGVANSGTIIGDRNFAIFNAPLWNLALIASRLHWIWISTVCGKLKTDLLYSNTIGWNTFPIPKLTKNNQEDLNNCANEILLARESHFPKSIAQIYKKDDFPENVKNAHFLNDEVVEQLYIGRSFKNDTERIEKLFDLYYKNINKKNSF